MWFKKRKDREALYVAQQCGILKEFTVVGDILHEDDLEDLRVHLFKIPKYTIGCLFEETTLEDSPCEQT